MTKKKASNCTRCGFWANDGCIRGHSPRTYKAYGTKRICPDHVPYTKPKPGFLSILFHTLFGSKNATV